MLYFSAFRRGDDVRMRKDCFPIFESWFSYNDVSLIFDDFARKVSWIKNWDSSQCSVFIWESDVIKCFGSAANDFFWDDFSFCGCCPFFINLEVVKWLDGGAIFIGSRKIIEKRFDSRNSILCENIEISRCSFKKRFEFCHSFFWRNEVLFWVWRFLIQNQAFFIFKFIVLWWKENLNQTSFFSLMKNTCIFEKNSYKLYIALYKCKNLFDKIIMKSYLIFKGLLLMVLWGILLFFPGESLQTIVIIFAVESILSLLYSLFFLVDQPDSNLKRNLILAAFSQLVFSLLILFFPAIMQFILSLGVVILAIILAIFWYNLLSIAKARQEVGLPYSSLLWIMGVLIILSAIFIGLNRFAMVLTLISLFGLVLMVLGFCFLIQGIRWGRPIVVEDFAEDEEE